MSDKNTKNYLSGEHRQPQLSRFHSHCMASESKSIPEFRFSARQKEAEDNELCSISPKSSVGPFNDNSDQALGRVGEARESMSKTDASKLAFQRMEFQYLSDNSNSNLDPLTVAGRDESLAFKITTFPNLTSGSVENTHGCVPETLDQKRSFHHQERLNYSISNLLSEEFDRSTLPSEVINDQKPVSLSGIYSGIANHEMYDFYSDMDHLKRYSDEASADNTTSKDPCFDKDGLKPSFDSSGTVTDRNRSFCGVVADDDVCFDKDDLMPSFDVIASEEIKWRKNLRRMKLLDFLSETQSPIKRINKMFEIADRIGEEIAVTKLRFNFGGDLSYDRRFADDEDPQQRLPSDYDSWSDNSHDDISSDDSDKDITSDDWDSDEYDLKVEPPIPDLNDARVGDDRKYVIGNDNDGKETLVSANGDDGKHHGLLSAMLNPVYDGDKDNDIIGDNKPLVNNQIANLVGDVSESSDQAINLYHESFEDIVAATAMPYHSVVAEDEDTIKNNRDNNDVDDERKAINGEDSKTENVVIVNRGVLGTVNSEGTPDGWVPLKKAGHENGISESSIPRLRQVELEKLDDDSGDGTDEFSSMGDGQRKQRKQQNEKKHMQPCEASNSIRTEIGGKDEDTIESGGGNNNRRCRKAGKGPIFVSEQRFGEKPADIVEEDMRDGIRFPQDQQDDEKRKIQDFEGIFFSEKQGNYFHLLVGSLYSRNSRWF